MTEIQLTVALSITSVHVYANNVCLTPNYGNRFGTFIIFKKNYRFILRKHQLVSTTNQVKNLNISVKIVIYIPNTSNIKFEFQFKSFQKCTNIFRIKHITLTIETPCAMRKDRCKCYLKIKNSLNIVYQNFPNWY